MELPEYDPEKDVPVEAVDKKDEPPQDVEGRVVLSADVVIEVRLLAELLGRTKAKLQEYILKRLEDVQEEEKVADKEFVSGVID